MENIDFLKILFDIHQSLPAWLRLVWLTVPPLFLLGIIILIIYTRLLNKQTNKKLIDDQDITNNSGDGRQSSAPSYAQELGLKSTVITFDTQSGDRDML